MLPTERRLAIVDEIRRRPMVRADELARRFEVSVETVRRDLRVLQRDGVLDRVYGGATPAHHRSTEAAFDDRRTQHIGQKRSIARLAAQLIEPGETIVLDVGTTALEVARALPETWPGRVLTCSIPVAVELAGRPRTEVLLSGEGCGRATSPCRARTRRSSSPTTTPTAPSSAPAACTPTPA